MNKKILLLVLSFMFLALFITPAWADTHAWTGAGTTNFFSDGKNWTGGVVPTTGDEIVFDGEAHGAVGAVPDKDCLIDKVATLTSLKLFSISSAYDGTISLNVNLTVNTFSQAGGTFNETTDANKTEYKITAGSKNITGGTFNGPSKPSTWAVGSTEPAIRIYTEYGLRHVYEGPDKNYVQTGDIVLGTGDFTSSIIGSDSKPFTGKYNGYGYTISNLQINSSYGYYLGLFGANSGTISNVGIVGSNSSIKASSYIGILVGSNAGTITNCYSTGSVTGTGNSVGGLVGENIVTYKGGGCGGGFEIDKIGKISNCYSTGSVTGGYYTGGLVGNNKGTIADCYFTGSVTGSSNAGGLVGYNDAGTIINSYYDIDNVLINDKHYVTVGGIYKDLYAAWVNGKMAPLVISDYFTLDSGFYQIASQKDLKNFLGFCYDSGSYKFKLTQNIDLSNPNLPNFTIPYLEVDTFDGNNKTISNLSLNMPFNDNIGLFCLVKEGTISNLGLVNVAITGTNYVGGLAGYNVAGTITNCYSAGTGIVVGTNYVGGLVGFNYDTITNCYSTVSVKGNDSVGGLVGFNCGTITNCYSTGSVAGSKNVGGLLGRNKGTVINSYYDIEKVLINGSNYVTVGGIYDDLYTTWINGSRAPLAINNYFARDFDGSFQISNLGDLKNFLGFACDSFEYYFKLTANIDLKDLPNFTIPFLEVNTFNGNNKIISNLSLNMPFSNDNVGLFGYIRTGTVSNLGVVNVNIKGISNVGGLAGENYGDITNCYSTGSVIGSGRVGGLVGDNSYQTITNCYSTVSVIGDWAVGGLVGGNNKGTIASCYSTGSVKGSHSVGGLTGQNWAGTISNCYSKGNVIGGMSTGGLVGHNEPSCYCENVTPGLIVNSYAIGTVTGSGSNNQDTGGLVGYNESIITNSYATGTVYGNYIVGGLVGFASPRSVITGSNAKGRVMGTDLTKVANLYKGTYIGGLIGINEGSIDSCYAVGAVSGLDHVGGLVGENIRNITKSYATGQVTAKDYVGGLLGINNARKNDSNEDVKGSVTNTYATGSMTQTGNNYIGGFAGYNSQGCSITNSYSIGKPYGLTNVGGFIGYNDNGFVNGSYWDTQTSGKTTSSGGTPKTTTYMKQQATFSGWDFAGTWIMVGYPHFRFEYRTIKGKVTYDNTSSTPLSGVVVSLKNLAGEVVATATTNSTGNYSFANTINSGTYTITASSTAAAKGINPTDALVINKYYAGTYALSGLKLKAGDVNNDTKVNQTDGLMINNYYIGKITSFPAGKWLFESKSVTVETTDATVDLKGICFGDVNGSYPA